MLKMKDLILAWIAHTQRYTKSCMYKRINAHLFISLCIETTILLRLSFFDTFNRPHWLV